MIENNQTLQALNLNSNQIGDVGKLIRNILNTTRLQKLDLLANTIGFEGLFNLIKALRSNTRLQVLGLDSQMENETEKQELENLINRTLNVNTSMLDFLLIQYGGIVKPNQQIFFNNICIEQLFINFERGYASRQEELIKKKHKFLKRGS